ncbi:MAG: hypothetical protein R3A80_11065 [Bdellovibrionota bacterium]
MNSKVSALKILFFTFVLTASAHNQDPQGIRKTLKPVFKKFGASIPSDYIKSTNVQQIDGRSVEVYAVKSAEGVLSGIVGKVEIQEVLYALGVDAKDGKLLIVSKKGKVLDEDQIQELDFVAPTSQGLVTLFKKK